MEGEIINSPFSSNASTRNYQYLECVNDVVGAPLENPISLPGRKMHNALLVAEVETSFLLF